MMYVTICIIFMTADMLVQERERYDKKAAVMEIKLKPKKYTMISDA